MNKYIVLDEDNIPIRSFHTKEEAVRFLQEGWSIKYVRKEKFNFNHYEEAPF